VLPSSNQCIDCHPDRAVAHGYDPAKHTATVSCVADCHSLVLGTTHSGSACQSCHATLVAAIKPWDKGCAACHETISHSTAGANHVGNDLSAGGCSSLTTGELGCHDTADVSRLHSDVIRGDGGCPICHGPTAYATGTTVCEDCHSNVSPYAAGSYHHNSVKYLAVRSDAPASAYYYDYAANGNKEPAGGWVDSLTNYDCQFCHATIGLGSGAAPRPSFAPYQGSMWYAGFSDDGYGYGYGGGIDDTLTIPAVSVPANANLTFMTYYDIHSSDSAKVELSTNGGTSWSALTGAVGGSTVSTITGTSTGWVPAQYNLSTYAGQTVSIRFHYRTDYTFSWAGIGVDDISIGNATQTVFSDNAEAANPALSTAGYNGVVIYHWDTYESHEGSGWIRTSALQPPPLDPEGKY